MKRRWPIRSGFAGLLALIAVPATAGAVAETFAAEIPGCRIEWRAVAPSESNLRNHLQVRREHCPLAFGRQWPVHRAILKQIVARGPLSDFASISWGGFGNGADGSWSLPVAVASYKSKAYAAYRAGRSGAGGINAVFVDLANETAAYADLRSLMHEFGADVRLTGVEKVFTGKAGNLPWAAALKEHGVPADARVIYDVGSAYFRIDAWSAEASDAETR